MCLPCKEIEDSQMPIVSVALFGRMLARVDSANDCANQPYAAASMPLRIRMRFSARQYEAPQFYIDSVNVQRGVMQHMIHHRLLTKDQTDRLLGRLQVFCERAAEVLKWTRTPEVRWPDRIGAWTETLYEWAHGDQLFFAALIEEIGDWHKHAKD